MRKMTIQTIQQVVRPTPTLVTIQQLLVEHQTVNLTNKTQQCTMVKTTGRCKHKGLHTLTTIVNVRCEKVKVLIKVNYIEL